jgi:hypothetical protein
MVATPMPANLRYARAVRLAWLLSLALIACNRPRSDRARIAPDPTPSASASVVASASTIPMPSSTVRAWTTCDHEPPKPPAKYASLRDVDWCNRTEIPGVSTLVKGVAELHEYAALGGLHDTDIFRLGSVAFGDLDADGVEEAAVVIDHASHRPGGGQWSEATVYVFALRRGAVVRLADSSTHLESSARIDKGAVLLGYGSSDAPCVQELQLAAAGGALVKGPDTCVEIP